MKTRTIHDVADALRKAKDRNKKATVFLGAGCSVTAGIPLSKGIVADIQKNHLRAYERVLARARESEASVATPSYADCMAELDPGPQRELIRGYVDNAKINWAHVGVGALVHAGCIDRLLTTNFDPLIARACALYNVFPAVYDLTMSAIERFTDLPDVSIFHLHGQRNGFKMLNANDELDKQTQRVEPLFSHAREERVWIVCGYSGENDPLLSLLKSPDRYDYALYWIGRDDEPPCTFALFI